MAIADSLGTVSMGLKVAPHIANAASSIATMFDNDLHVGSFGELTTSSRYISQQRTL